MSSPSTPSVVLTVQTKTVFTGAALLNNIMLHPGSAAASITVYDNIAGSGTILAILQGVANGATVIFPFDDSPPFAHTAITCVVAGTGAQAQVYFQPE